MRKLISKFSALAILLSVVGCASSPTRWHLNGKSHEEFNSRHYSCDEFAARNSMPATNYGGANPYSALASLVSLSGQSAGMTMIYEACMNEAGYTKAK
jgi:hypothetical protein